MQDFFGVLLEYESLLKIVLRSENLSCYISTVDSLFFQRSALCLLLFEYSENCLLYFRKILLIVTRISFVGVSFLMLIYFPQNFLIFY